MKRLTKLYAQKEGTDTPPLTDGQIELFMTRALARAGAEEMITPREIIRDYLTLLNILRDNKDANFDVLLKNITADSDLQTSPSELDENSILAIAKPKNKFDLFDIEI